VGAGDRQDHAAPRLAAGVGNPGDRCPASGTDPAAVRGGEQAAARAFRASLGRLALAREYQVLRNSCEPSISCPVAVS
jgi:hypothetical protein